jgi:tyrosyl-DNA phosphodiesterase 1
MSPENSPNKQDQRSENKEKIITIQASSLGRLNSRYLGLFYGCCTDAKVMNVSKNYRIIFPTDEFVKASYLGAENANSLFLNQEYWNNNEDFPRNSFYKQESVSEETDHNLFHAKIMVFHNKEDAEINDETAIYVGSHNFSPSAWGNISRSSALYISNWEFGLLFTPQKDTTEVKKRVIS